MTMSLNQPSGAAEPCSLAITTLSVRVAPLTAAMLAQVPVEDILDGGTATLCGELIDKVFLP